MKTLSQLIADNGVDEAREVQLMRRRARAALLRDRMKVFARTPLGNIPVFGRHPSGRSLTVHDINADLLTMKLAADGVISAHEYVAAWCRLNHLKH